MDFHHHLARLEAAGLRRAMQPVDGPQGATLRYQGRTVINLASNNYLGLADHPEVVAAAHAGLKTYGFGGGAARLISGNHRIFEQLEQKLAALKGCEAAVLFSSGYAANLGLMQALAPQGTVFCDRLSHASLIDGARLAGATMRIYPHRDSAALATLLTRTDGPKVIATDTVFSMDGDLAPLPQLADLAQTHDALLMVDDAHGTGVLGGGRGSGHHFQLSPQQLPVQMGTLGKALGGHGAFVAGSAELIDYLINHAHSFIYTTAPPPAMAAGMMAALEILTGDEGRQMVAQLHANRAYFAQGLAAMGCPVPDAPTPIIPIQVGAADRALALSKSLLERGILAPCVRPPTVPKGTSRLRCTVMASHSHSQLDQALEAIGDCHVPV